MIYKFIFICISKIKYENNYMFWLNKLCCIIFVLLKLVNKIIVKFFVNRIKIEVFLNFLNE